jgi:hypothetical protein
VRKTLEAESGGEHKRAMPSINLYSGQTRHGMRLGLLFYRRTVFRKPELEQQRVIFCDVQELARQLQSEADREAAASAPAALNLMSSAQFLINPFALFESVLMGDYSPVMGHGRSRHAPGTSNGRSTARSQPPFSQSFPGSFQIDPRLLGLSMIDRVRSTHNHSHVRMHLLALVCSVAQTL